MSDMFYGCTSLKTLDLSNYSITNVTNMQNMFNKMTSLASMQVSNQFVVVANSNGIFDNTDSLKAIIVSNKIPKAGAFTNVKDSLSSNVKFYVPTEEAYEKSWANDFGKERIEPILQLVGKTPIRANINETYQDAGYLVAGFEMEKAELYNCYGYTVTMLNTVDTSKEQTQTLTYRISRTYQSGAETIQEDLMDATREIKVVDLDKYMITEWNVSGDAGLEITLPVSGTGLNIIVDWGDGTEETITQEYPTHTYARAGVYEIAVAGNCPEWGRISYQEFMAFNENSKNYTYAKYLTKVKQFGELNATKYVFAKCENLISVAGENLVSPNTFKNINSMEYMFWGCDKLKELDLTKFDTQNVKIMNRSFAGCSELTSFDLSNFDTSKVTTMDSMFVGCTKLTELNLEKFNTSLVENMSYMFASCNKLEYINLSGFNTEKVKAMSWMFGNCRSLKTLDLSSFNTQNVTTMECMFYGMSALELNISNFDTSNVKNMYSMFALTKIKKLNLSHFNTENVENMNGMFYLSGVETLDISNFDTRKVTDMAGMFKGNKNLETLDISSFDTKEMTRTTNANGKITTGMDEIFCNTSQLKSIQIGENFVIPEGSEKVFDNCNSLTAVITTSKTPVANQFKNELPSYTKLYVPNGCEEAYKEILSGDTASDKIKPVIEPKGEKEIGILLGTSYEEQNYTVAGFGIEDAKYYMAYGYDVQTKGEINTNEKGTYKIEYILTRTYIDQEGNEKQEQHIATRTVYVYDSPIVHLYENNKSYYGDWTNQDVVAIMKILSPQTTWVSVKVENGDWTEEPSYADIVKSGEQMVVTFHESLNGKVYFKEVDVTGNATTYQSEPSIIKIDKEKPVVQDMTAKTIDGVIKLEAKVFDSLSGIEKYSIMQSGETQISWKEYDRTDGKIEEILPSSGTYYLWLKDVAGNVSSGDYMNVIKDVEAPKGTIDIIPTNVVSGDKYTNQDTVLINLNVTDNQTEQARIMYALYNEEDYEQVKAGTKEIEWKQYIPTVTWTLKEQQGINIIYAVFKDTAGNVTMTKGAAVQKP